MNSKKVNWFFLTTILLHIFIVVLMVVFRYVFSMSIIANFFISSGIILVPALSVLALSGDDWRQILGFHRIKWTTAGMIVLFTFLTMPLTSLINAFSMFFVENAVSGISGDVLEIPFVVTFFFMAVNAPVCEEIVFRGVVYKGYRKSGTVIQAAVFSALLFAIGHMNFNQAAYAFVIGIILVLLVEATGSIWASIIYHVTFNGYSVCMMYLANILYPGEIVDEVIEGQAYIESIIYMIGFFVVITAGASAIAVCVFIWIAKNENRLPRLKQIWSLRRAKKGRIVTIPLVIALVLSIAYMVTDAVLYRVLS